METVKHTGASIYNPHRPGLGDLEFLVGSDETSWRAQRNLRKPLNHLELLRSKQNALFILGLDKTNSPAAYDRGFKILQDYHMGDISAEEAIGRIAANSGLAIPNVSLLLEEYFHIGHLEFHPSDICNLKCLGCTYGQGVEGIEPKQEVFQFGYLGKLRALQPRSILLSGGGEPTLYNDETHRLDALVEEISELLPDTLIALITNGTIFLDGDWTNHLGWVRLSIDAATSETYEKIKGKSFLDKVEENLLHYLDSPIPMVGATFLYSRANIDEYVDFLTHFYSLVRSKNPDALKKLNISFRPLRQNPTDIGREFPQGISDEQISDTVGKIIALAARDSEIKAFMSNQTNIEAVLGGNQQPPLPFGRCYYSQIFHIVRANGDVRPCYVRVFEPDFVLGNIIHDSPAAISLHVIYNGLRQEEHCSPLHCRQCHVNYVLERGLAGELKPSENPKIGQDPFF